MYVLADYCRKGIFNIEPGNAVDHASKINLFLKGISDDIFRR